MQKHLSAARQRGERQPYLFICPSDVTKGKGNAGKQTSLRRNVHFPEVSRRLSELRLECQDSVTVAMKEDFIWMGNQPRNDSTCCLSSLLLLFLLSNPWIVPCMPCLQNVASCQRCLTFPWLYPRVRAEWEGKRETSHPLSRKGICSLK